LGFMALAANVQQNPEYASGFAQFRNNFAVPALILEVFPDWFVGFAFAAIGIGALVPAAIMSIAAANLFTRNIYREFLNPNCAPRVESQMAKTTSLVVKVGALLFIILLPQEYAINMQLLGGIWIIQTFPAIILGLYTRWLDPRALTIGWAAGMILGTWMGASIGFRPIYPLEIFGTTLPGYIAIYSVLVNFALSFGLSAVFNASAKGRADETMPGDYAAEGSGVGGMGHH